FSSRRRHTRFSRDWSSDVCSSDLTVEIPKIIEKLYPDLEPSEVMTVSEAVHASMGIQSTGGLFDEADLPADAEFMVPPGVNETRSEERRVGRECRCRWSSGHQKKQ